MTTRTETRTEMQTRKVPLAAGSSGGAATEIDPWRGFWGGAWRDRIDVRAFIQRNYQPYEGDETFLADATERTGRLREKYEDLCRRERESGGVLDIDTARAASQTAWGPGYLDRDAEIIVGLQTDAPLKRTVNPYGGIRMARKACEAYGYELDESLVEAFTRYRTTHNDGVFRVYNDEMRSARRSGVITGLPDAYGRGRIIGDYRRVALYGVDRLLEAKREDKRRLSEGEMSERAIREIEELACQIDALDQLKRLAESYGFDISAPARTAREAIQWLYFGYLAAIKEQNGAAMSLGRVSTFLDIYLQRDLDEGTLDETAAQELIDDFSLKLRMARQLRTSEYNALFAGDPMWITEAIAGVGEDGRPLVTRTSFRMLHTLYTLGPAPEPNLTVLWSERLPEPFRRYCAKVSIDTASIQYENDELMRERYGDDYGIACCVSAMRIGEQMQFFGARANLPKALLMAINGGRDEISGEQVGPKAAILDEEVLDYQTVRRRFEETMDWLCGLYVRTMNIIHRMHDRYAYEQLQMALHDSDVERFMAFGIAGLSVAADSLSAIRHAKVRPVRDERGLAVDFQVEGEYPAYGNDDDRADAIARELVEGFIARLRAHRAYRDAKHTLSILTITSNVVYGDKTGPTPDGRKAGESFAPGANPMHNRDRRGALASLNSVAKIPYDACRDGVSCTFSVTPRTLGAEDAGRADTLDGILAGYFRQGGQHLNVNVLDRRRLEEAMEDPASHPNLTIRVSGYAVNFHSLNRKQQEEVISRTYHESL